MNLDKCSSRVGSKSFHEVGTDMGESFLGDQDINVHESLLGLTKKFFMN